MARLPIADFRKIIVDSVMDNQVTLIRAETGAGKTTQAPQYLAELGLPIIITQPRRLTAETVALRVAREMDTFIGMEVGYQTAFECMVSEQTKITFCTDGLELLRELSNKPREEILIIDEVHEWSLNIEMLVAWAKLRLKENPLLRIVLMSATVQSTPIERFFNRLKVIDVPGQSFPIEDQAPRGTIIEDAMRMIEKDRNVLIFVAGKKEIGEIIEQLEACHANAELIPLHANMSWEEQNRALDTYDRPKCVISC